MTTATYPELRLTQHASGGGCACKVPPGELERVRPEDDLLDLRRRQRAAPAQDRIDAQDQFARIEGLGQIIIRSRFEALDAVVGLRQGGQHEDRDLLFLAQRFRQLDPRFPRHHHVENDQVEVEPGQFAARLRRIAGDRHSKAVLAQILLKQAADTRVVIDHEQMGGIVIENG